MSSIFKELILVFLLLTLFDFQKTIAHSGRRNWNQKSCEYFKDGRIYRGQCNGGFNSRNKLRVGSQKANEEEYAPCRTTEGIAGICRPPAYCFSQYDNMEQYVSNKCQRGNGFIGICCPQNDLREPLVRSVPFKFPVPYEPTTNVDIDRATIDAAIEEAIQTLSEHSATEKHLIRSGFYQKSHTMEHYHQAFFGPNDPQIQQITNDGNHILQISRHLTRRLNLSPTQARDGLHRYSLLDTRLANHCPKIPRCQPNYKYRTIDGNCNNLRHPLWGKSLTQFIRLLPPQYADGINEFRMSVDGAPLPGPRELSNKLAINGELTDKKLSVIFMQWGQFMDHDLTLGASTRARSGEGLICCNRTTRTSRVSHPACKPIIIPRDDPFYSRFNQRCNNFVRNAAGPRYNCNLGYREQINVITHFMDGSMIYGNTDERSKIVRTFKNGLLKTSRIENDRHFLPFDSTNLSLACTIPRSSGLQCVFAGDVRVNQQLGLTLLQLIFLREHNRIANQLENMNPVWNDETVFQETRRIIGALIQSISYNEWLPLILGRRIMKEFGLLPKPSGYCFDYNPNLNPGILNEFATASYRWHTLVQGFYNLMHSNGQITDRIQLRSIFNNPSNLYRRGTIDMALNGITGQASQAFDPIFSEDIRNNLFPSPNSSFGMDLVALNIQRGRDHGLTNYNNFREICGLPRVRNFHELDQELRQGSAQQFAQIYRDVDDIDLFIAGVHEKPLREGILGPTFACITAEQFRRTKYGDRFWFEIGNMGHSFSEAQLNEIRKVSLAGLICENGDNIRHMQPLAFLQPSDLNPRIDCSQIPQMNLNFWRNERV